MSSNLDPGGGGGGDDGGGDDGGGDDSDGDNGSGSGTAVAIVASALGISTAAVSDVAEFAQGLADAESPTEYIVEIVLTEFVGWVLGIAEAGFGLLLQSINIVAESLWESTVVPVRIAFRNFWGLIFGALESIRVTTEAGLSEAGLAAPVVALGGWVAVLLVTVILLSIVWALAETYLPTEAVVANVERIVVLALTPVRVASEFASGAAESVGRLVGRDGDGGDSN